MKPGCNTHSHKKKQKSVTEIRPKNMSIHDKYLEMENKDKRPPMSPLYYRSKNTTFKISQHRKSNMEQLNNIFQKSAKTLRPKSLNENYESNKPHI